MAATLLRLIALLVMPIGRDADLLQGNHPLVHHPIQFGEEPLDRFRPVDDLDDDGKVFRQPEDPGRVDAAIRAETLQAAQHGRSGQPDLAGPAHDRLVERSPPIGRSRR